MVAAGMAAAVQAGVAGAHELETSYASVQVRGDTMAIEFAIESADITGGFAIMPSYGDKASGEELMANGARVSEYVTSRSRITADGTVLSWPQARMRTGTDEEGNIFLRLLYVIGLDSEVVDLGLRIDLSEKFSEDHKTLAKLFAEGFPSQQTVFSSSEPERYFTVGEEVSLWANAVEFTVLGIEHIFIGYDHIMFLLALIIVGGRLIGMVKIGTSFTVAHSITLVLAALEIVTLPGKWIEAGIAFSIAYVALENFWLKRSDLRWVITFFFGLVHGFGFANVLRDRPGLHRRHPIPDNPLGELAAVPAAGGAGRLCDHLPVRSRLAHRTGVRARLHAHIMTARSRLLRLLLLALAAGDVHAAVLIDQAEGSGVLDPLTAAIYRVQAVRNQELVPAQYREEPEIAVCGTPIVSAAGAMLRDLEGDDRRRLAKALTRPSRDLEQVTASGPFQRH